MSYSSTLKDALRVHALKAKENVEHANVSKHVILFAAISAVRISGLVVLDRIDLANESHRLLTAYTLGRLVGLNPVRFATEFAASSERFNRVIWAKRVFAASDTLKQDSVFWKLHWHVLVR